MNIKELRQSTNMTQVQFGEYLNISPRTIQNWEINRTTPPDYVVELIEYKLRKERKLNMYKLVLKEEGQEDILTKGTIIELIKYLKDEYDNLFSWIETDHNSQLPVELEKIELPTFENVETLRSLEYELEKVDMDWWEIVIEDM